jgi:hypothetical protein
MKRIIAIVLAASLAGCATPATQNALDNASHYCQAGYSGACEQVPALQVQAINEAATNRQLATMLILLPLYILVATH